MSEYAELSWANLGTILTDKDESENAFCQKWAKTVSEKFDGVEESAILQLYDSNKDTHDSDWRVREDWKYAASIGISATPQAYVNGVLLDEYPTEANDWKEFLDSLLSQAHNHYMHY